MTSNFNFFNIKVIGSDLRIHKKLFMWYALQQSPSKLIPWIRHSRSVLSVSYIWIFRIWLSVVMWMGCNCLSVLTVLAGVNRMKSDSACYVDDASALIYSLRSREQTKIAPVPPSVFSRERPFRPFISFSSCRDASSDVKQLVQIWNDHLMQHSLKINFKERYFVMIDPNETGTIRIECFRYLGFILQWTI